MGCAKCLWCPCECGWQTKSCLHTTVADSPQYLGRSTCVPAAPAPAVRVCGDNQFVFWCVYSVFFFISRDCFNFSFKILKTTMKNQVRRTQLLSEERYWTADWYYGTAALLLPAPSSFLVFRWWEIWRGGTIKPLCCFSVTVILLHWVIFQTYFKSPFQSVCPCTLWIFLSLCMLSSDLHAVMLNFCETEYTKANKMKPFMFTFRFPWTWCLWEK